MRLLRVILIVVWTAQVSGQDHTGPKLISAVVNENAATNLVVVTFDEPLLAAGATNTGNYKVTQFGVTNNVPVLSALRFGSNVLLWLGSEHWYVGGLSNYYLTVSHVRDLASNTIAPDSRIGVSWPRHTEVLRPNATWRYQAPIMEPGLLLQPRWASCDYVESPWWVEGSAPFTTDGPALFRTEFVCSPELAASGRLRFDYLVEGGAVFFLNGIDVAHVNLCQAPASSSNRCCVFYLVAPPPVGSKSVTITNLLAGTNCLGVMISPEYCLPVLWSVRGTARFGLQLWVTQVAAGPVPPEDVPVLQITRQGSKSVRLSWEGSGFALEQMTQPTGDILSPPKASWVEVPDMSNPYTSFIETNQNGLFRLRK